MNISPLGIAVIQHFEDYVDKAYRRFPHEPWTCGWGHTGVDVTEGTTCTPAQALQWLMEDVAVEEAGVRHDVKVPLTQHQFDALVSLAYNAGSVVLEHRSGEVWVESTLLHFLNTGQLVHAAEQFLAWDHISGVENKGLERRRELEKALFLDGVLI